MAISRWPEGPATSTTASSAARGTAKSEGFVAMHLSDQPLTAWLWVSPPLAAQPVPGSRRLQGLQGSWK